MNGSNITTNLSTTLGPGPGRTTTNTVAWVVFSLSLFLAVVVGVIISLVVAYLKKKNQKTVASAIVTGRIADETTLTQWQEAAAFVTEGLEHIKFSDHPTEKIASFVYDVVHSTAYRVYHLVVTVALLLLALFEFPTVFLGENSYPTYLSDWLRIVAAFEFVILLLLLLDLTLTLMWLKPHRFFTSKMKVVASVVLLLMFIEVIVVMARNDYHPRVLRALRPIFFINSQLMYAMRRVMKEIFKVFTTILDVILLLLFLIVIFSIFGYYLLATSNPDYFSTYGRSFVSMFVLVTTANFPDVMLESYHVLPYSPIFFIIYLVITLYIVANLILAVIYNSFSVEAKKKFKKLYLHKREAIRRAYDVLKAADNSGIKFQDFLLFMEEYQPEKAEWEVMCIYKALQKTDALSTNGPTSTNSLATPLTLDQFYGLYQITDLNWRHVENKVKGSRTPIWLYKIILWIRKLVTWQWFDAVISVIVIINIICAIVFAAQVGEDDLENRYSRAVSAGELSTSFVFTGIFCIEILLRIIGLGLISYFRSVWNVCDFLIIVISFIAQFLELHPALQYATLVRPLKLLRLLRLKRRYRNIVNTITLLVTRIVSVALLVVAMYYFFAIIGMEVFRHQVYPQCCQNGWFFIGGLYSGAQNSTLPNVYWLNNFDNILQSYVTLFELMVINNWFVIMEGFASEAAQHAQPFVRLYFIVFYMCVLVITTVIISFVVEAFTFRLALGNEKAKNKQNCRRYHKKDCNCYSQKSNTWKKVEVEISQTEATDLDNKVKEAHAMREITADSLNEIDKTYNIIMKYWKKLHKVTPESKSDKYLYIGSRRRTPDDLYLLMNRDEVKHWTEDKGSVQGTDSATPEPNPWKRKLKRKLIDFIEFIFE